MSKRIISVQTAILRTADPKTLTTRIEYSKLSDPEPDDEDQRPLYQVTTFLESE